MPLTGGLFLRFKEIGNVLNTIKQNIEVTLVSLATIGEHAVAVYVILPSLLFLSVFLLFT